MPRRLLLSLAFTLVLVLGVVLVRSQRLREVVTIEVTLWPPQIEFYPPSRVSLIRQLRGMSEQEVAALAPEMRVEVIAQRTGICELHQAKMQRRWVPVSYDLRERYHAPSVVESAKFPHGADTIPGGCTVAAQEYEVFRCAQCEAAYRAWAVERDRRLAAQRGPVLVRTK